MLDSALAFAGVIISLIVALLTWWNNRHNRATILALRLEIAALEDRLTEIDGKYTRCQQERAALREENHRLLDRVVHPANCGVQHCPHPRAG